jgi:hypothetical protein
MYFAFYLGSGHGGNPHMAVVFLLIIVSSIVSLPSSKAAEICEAPFISGASEGGMPPHYRKFDRFSLVLKGR